jgi:amino acid transporter
MDMDCRQAVSSYIAYAVDLDSPRIGNVTIVQLGPVVIIWGFVIACACTTIVAFSLAEICSAYPSAGSVYHWAAQVVPEKYAPLSSYVCGWSNFLGNAAGDASFAYSFATFLNAAIVASDYQPYSLPATVGVSILTIFMWSFLNFFRIDQVAWINKLAAVCHCGAILIIIFSILLMPQDLNSSERVFALYHNETGFQSPVYVCLIGLLSATFAFTGLEASAHMAEETVGSAEAAPRGIIYTVLATGIGGLGYLFALLFATVDISAALNGDTEVAAVNVFIISCGKSYGSALTWLVVINLFFAGISSVAVTGRITYALMRDEAFPYSKFFGQVHPTLKSPIHSIMFVCIIDSFLQLLALNSDGVTAFYSITGLCVIGFQVSYCLPVMLKVIFEPADFPATTMSLGKWSKVFGIISSVWLIATSVLLFLPTNSPVTPKNMNWLVVVFSFTVICSTLYWIYQGQYTFKGPPRFSQNQQILHNHEVQSHNDDKTITTVNPLISEKLEPLLTSSL